MAGILPRARPPMRGPDANGGCKRLNATQPRFDGPSVRRLSRPPLIGCQGVLACSGRQDSIRSQASPVVNKFTIFVTCLARTCAAFPLVND